MDRTYRPFIDWMKAIGISLIVMGHVAGRPTNYLLPPIYPKQLGVAFFIFIMGYSLASETRPRWQVVFNRLFEVYLFGGAMAILLSIIMFTTRGTLQLIIFSGVVQPNHLFRLLGVRWRDYLRIVVPGCLAAFATMAAVSALGTSSLPSGSWTQFVLKGGLCVCPPHSRGYLP